MSTISVQPIEANALQRPPTADTAERLVVLEKDDFHAIKIAILIPCYNEELTIAKVVQDFRAAVPRAEVYVYDNNSTDNTVESARLAGAIVAREPRQGKGNVVRRMFGDIEADIYVLVDGDGTYQASAVPKLIAKLMNERLDLVNVARVTNQAAAYRQGHKFGNQVLTYLVRAIFGRQFRDMLSGYKVLSRRFVKSFPAMSSGFETETELAIHALELRLACSEAEADYFERPKGSSSKLRTFRDGFRILWLIASLVRNERPLLLFGILAVVLILLAVVLGVPIVYTYIQTGLVPRFPTAILSASLVILGMLSFFTGLILQMTTRSRQELKRLIYLALPIARRLDE